MPTTNMDPRVQLVQAVDTLLGLESLGTAPDAECYHRVASAMHGLSASIAFAERSNVPCEDIRAIVAEARAFHKMSPFVKRIQTWPRGYPGDFETVEYLTRGQVDWSLSSVARAIEQVCLRDAAAQQHRNKIAWQARKILQVATGRQHARILSVACGSSLDFRSVAPLITPHAPHATLNDSDPDALAASREILENSGVTVSAVLGNVFHSINELLANAPYDLILVGGLCDYLTDGLCRRLFSRLASMLRAEGSLCFTNIADDNSDRVWLEYIADWPLVGRSEDRLRQIVSRAAKNALSIDVARDSTGMTFLVEIRV